MCGMCHVWTRLSLLVLVSPLVAGSEWAVHVAGGATAAAALAARHGMSLGGEIIPGTGYFLLRREGGGRDRRETARELFAGDGEVDWAEEQRGRVRVKRDPLSASDPHFYDYKFSRRLVDNLLMGRQVTGL